MTDQNFMSQQDQDFFNTISEAKINAWANYINQIQTEYQAEEYRKQQESELIQHLNRIEVAEKKIKQAEEIRREELQKHLAGLKLKKEEQNSYNALSLLERRIYKALVNWRKTESEEVPDGILEINFKATVLQSVHFEKISGDIDSTLKIRKLKGSAKLKEMLLVFKRGKNIFLEFYQKDLKENIYTFMFMGGKMMSNQKSPEVMHVIEHFKKFGPAMQMA